MLWKNSKECSFSENFYDGHKENTMVLVKVIAFTLLCIIVSNYGFHIRIRRKGYTRLGEIKVS